MRFESKRDLWIIVLLRVFPLVVLAIVAVAWYLRHGDVRGPIAGVIVVIGVELLFFESLFRSTYYVIDGSTLLIRSSFLRWRIPIGEITAITPTRSAISSPALSLDRLRIDYSDTFILVSPEKQGQFIEALRSANPAITTMIRG
ncbi:MAG TPA: PH domain-containing protein [Thermoanaerobaculia bacterium]|nr:PH domain-containing protein [Thermoanaerobaculia bacterium]